MKILVIHNYPTPIRNFYFQEMQKFLAAKNIAFKVIFLSQGDKNRHWKKSKELPFEHRFLPNFALRVGTKDLFTFFINPQIWQTLNQENPDKIICAGWDHLSAYLANFWCRKHNKEFILWSGSTIYEPSWRRTLFTPLVKFLIRRTQKIWAYGTRAKEYLIKLGATAEQIEILWNTCDVDFFLQQSDQLDKQDLRQKYKLEGKIVLFFNGQLIERKGVFELIDGFKLALEQNPQLFLLMLGQGQAEEALKQKIAVLNLTDQVKLLGHQEYEQLSKYYKMADIFILPSKEEVWGLVINEAMCFNLPIITSKMTGASADLVQHGQNGYVLPNISAKEIQQAIQFVLEKNLIQNNNSEVIIQNFRLQDKLEKLNFFG